MIEDKNGEGVEATRRSFLCQFVVLVIGATRRRMGDSKVKRPQESAILIKNEIQILVQRQPFNEYEYNFELDFSFDILAT